MLPIEDLTFKLESELRTEVLKMQRVEDEKQDVAGENRQQTPKAQTISGN
ncbi:hypothetical protein [Rubrolithibacter danxiaensis]